MSNEIQKLTLGQQFRLKREELDVSVEQVSHTIKIAPALVQAMEEGNYRPFTAKIYAKGIAKKLAAYYRLPSDGAAGELAAQEWSAYRNMREDSARVSRALGVRGIFYITPIRLLGVGALMFVLFFAGLFGWRLKLFMGTPALSVYEPVRHTTTDVPYVRVRGVAARESRLTMNGRDITIDESGSFNQEVELLAGVNQLHFLVQNRFGKTTEETRYVVVK